MGNYVGTKPTVETTELSAMAKEFIAKAGNDWNRYLWKLAKARSYAEPLRQTILNEAIDILRPHLDSYNTEEKMTGEELWKELAAYTGVIAE